MKRLSVCVAVVMIGVLGNQARAQGEIHFAKTFPKFLPDNATNSKITVKGHVALAAGYSVVTNKVLVRVWEKDGKALVTPLANPPVNAQGHWGPVDTNGLKLLTYYHVTVEATISNGANTVIIITNPHTGKTP